MPVSKHSLISFSNAKLISPAGPTQAQLEDRIVNPDLRDHSLPGPYWTFGATNSTTFCLHLICSKCWSAKLHFEQEVTECLLDGCTFVHFLPWRTASVEILFTENKQMAIKIPLFLKISETVGF
eukprot:GFUD01093424.1.p1 GENE.GFUD01093424.1~~GFUD01093424.1.p1  ORF type:complete len:124 (-),score=13.83 GFUD01093424.1:368-739(-)